MQENRKSYEKLNNLDPKRKVVNHLSRQTIELFLCLSVLVNICLFHLFLTISVPMSDLFSSIHRTGKVEFH
jgi:hypothetical protein